VLAVTFLEAVVPQDQTHPSTAQAIISTTWGFQATNCHPRNSIDSAPQNPCASDLSHLGQPIVNASPATSTISKAFIAAAAGAWGPPFMTSEVCFGALAVEVLCCRKARGNEHLYLKIL